MAAQPRLRIGTRGSRLALAQAAEVKARLVAAHPGLDPDMVSLEVIRTTGDRIKDKPLRDFGGKGLFTKEIEEALLAGGIDLAVHSMKDMPTFLPPGLAIRCYLPREDPRDAFLSPHAAGLGGLPEGALVGTSSLRRQAQVKHRRPDLRVATFRGNLETRLRKLADGEVDATLLAVAGLKRIGLDDRITSILKPEMLLPAIAQGAIGIEAREDDDETASLLAPVNDAATAICVEMERAFLAALDGSCHTPIAGLATIAEDGTVSFRGQILTPDGAEAHETTRSGPAADAAAMGRDAGLELHRRAGPDFFAEQP